MVSKIKNKWKLYDKRLGFKVYKNETPFKATKGGKLLRPRYTLKKVGTKTIQYFKNNSQHSPSKIYLKKRYKSNSRSSFKSRSKSLSKSTSKSRGKFMYTGNDGKRVYANDKYDMYNDPFAF